MKYIIKFVKPYKTTQFRALRLESALYNNNNILSTVNIINPIISTKNIIVIFTVRLGTETIDSIGAITRSSGI